MGGAWSQSSECGEADPSNLAMFMASAALEVIRAWWFCTTGLFHAF